MKNLETEFKWNAQTPRAFMRMLGAVKQLAYAEEISAPTALHITDTYLDQPDGTFEKEQLAFRVRHCEKTWEATFKTRTQLVNGKAVRREETQKLPGVKNIQQALEKLAAQKIWKNLPVRGLRPLFTICNKRLVRVITRTHFRAELAFDTCTIYAGNKHVKFKEIELELKQGRADNFDKFAQQLTVQSGLARAEKSKVKTAVSLLKGEL